MIRNCPIPESVYRKLTSRVELRIGLFQARNSIIHVDVVPGFTVPSLASCSAMLLDPTVAVDEKSARTTFIPAVLISYRD
jgi:hypothetical protein